MPRKLTFRQKLFLNFSIIFAVFTALVLVFQFEREQSFSRSNFEVTLDNLAQLSYGFYTNQDMYEGDNYRLIDSLSVLVSDLDIRVTIMDRDGKVLFDSEVADVEHMENHRDRPEVQEARMEGTGANIRHSETTGLDYYYYVRAYPDSFVRVAAIYDVMVRETLHVERLFIAYLVLLFLVYSVVLMFFTRRIAETIRKLKDFATSLRSGKEPPEAVSFPDDDLGEISSQVTSIYRDLNKAREEIQAQQEKLFTHLNNLEEGIAFFSEEKQPFLTNQQFIQNLNLVSGKSSVTPEEIFGLPVMETTVAFIDETLACPECIKADDLPSRMEVVQRSGRYFRISCMFFLDHSFEVVITNITRLEKRKQMKQEMTSNIAHELKTPVTAILGYLETLHEEDMPKKTRKLFLKGALRQTERLSGLIGDIASLNKIEEAPGTYQMDKVRIRKVVDEVRRHMIPKLEAKNIEVQVHIPRKMEITGNVSLLHSIFYNLFENVLKYGGEGIEVRLDNYMEDQKYYYFSFRNSGTVVDEVHLNRLFERFYRIDTGRSRDEGGTGLGLSIVKNAIELHGGKISVKSPPEGGLEFLFTLSKSTS